MGHLAAHRNAWIVLIALTFAPRGARAQAPCTDEQARQWPGSLTLDRAEEADLDRRFRGKPDPAVLRKIDQGIKLLQQALPDLRGAAGHYNHEIADPGPHVERFWITAPFFDYYCNHISREDPPAPAGKILMSDETGSWIYIYFNSLGWLVNESASLGKEMRTPLGETIFRLPWQDGEWKGHPVFSPALHGDSSAAIILTPPGRFPFKPVSRDEFLQAREAVAQKYLDEARRAGGPDSSGAKYRASQLEELRKLHASMNASDLQSQAVVREWGGDPKWGRIFGTQAQHGQRLVTVEHTYIDKSLPKSAVQLIVVYWRWEERNPAKRELNQQFRRNFDVAALEKMIDR